MQITVTLDYDASAPWKRLRKILPFGAGTEIAAKYLLSLTALLASIVVNLIVSIPFCIANESKWGFFAFGAAAACVCAALYLMIAIPAIYRFGVSKGRMVLLCFVFLLAMAPMALSPMLGMSLIEAVSSWNKTTLAVVASVIATGGVVCSVLASLRAIQRPAVGNRQSKRE